MTHKTKHIIINYSGRVLHAALWATMRKFNISANLDRTIEQLYDKGTSAVQLNGITGNVSNNSWSKARMSSVIKRLQHFFSNGSCLVLWENMMERINIDGRNISIPRLAYDKDALTKEEQEL